MTSAATAAKPMRYPDTRSREVMTKRAWWLVVLNLLIPGSAQVLAGNRKLGRFGLFCTLSLWVVAIVAVVAYLLWPAPVITIATNWFTLTAVQVLLALYAVLWVVLTLDTLRLVRLVRASPNARLGVALFATLALVAVAGTAGYGAVVAGSARGTIGSIFAQTAPVEPVDGYYTFLLLGGDAGADREGLRPDSTSVVAVNAETGKATAFGLPRDLDPVPFPEGSEMASLYPNGYGYEDDCDVDVCQLNSIYTEIQLKNPELFPKAEAAGSEPGIEAMKQAAEGATGLKIQYYVLVDMQGFATLIDALGGITMTPTQRLPMDGDEDLNDVTEWIEPGKQVMDGRTALMYARSRHSTSDYDRIARQRELQDAMLKQFNPTNVLLRFQEIAAASPDVVKTDVPQSMLGYFVNLAGKTKAAGLASVEFVPPLIDPTEPDYGLIKQTVQDTLWPPTPTADPTDAG
ncbi:transcriptional regulator [Plantibacter sp. H53]|uniref:LCP family protein n=1 Tax=unclassified Plantibacter TaxID=2624265 RepID=UPI0007D9E668|nr:MULTISPECIES: LCP family protein [unclassified Plantibacter]OAN33146.1 transcriptional regulator [Plantibacter sp. H53]OII34357.1 transcriptional regulator [Plantibacter sp. MMLR14_011]